MTQFKITIHAGQHNAISLEEFESKDAALAQYSSMLQGSSLLRFGEVLVNPALITFLQVEEVVVAPLESTETIEVGN